MNPKCYPFLKVNWVGFGRCHADLYLKINKKFEDFNFPLLNVQRWVYLLRPVQPYHSWANIIWREHPFIKQLTIWRENIPIFEQHLRGESLGAGCSGRLHTRWIRRADSGGQVGGGGVCTPFFVLKVQSNDILPRFFNLKASPDPIHSGLRYFLFYFLL